MSGRDPGRPPVLLIVEDEAPNRALLRAVVGRSRDPALETATLIEAGDLAAARAVLDRETVDVVVLDVRLPDGNGLDLARELRDRGPDRPRVLVLSASVLPTERSAAMEAGADSFIAKPYDVRELVAVLSEFVARKG